MKIKRMSSKVTLEYMAGMAPSTFGSIPRKDTYLLANFCKRETRSRLATSAHCARSGSS